MSGHHARVQAVTQVVNRQPQPAKTPSSLSSIWAENVFNLGTMQETLPKSVFKSIKKTIVSGESLDPAIADTVAHAMRDWAMSKGALYYAHVFYP
ncbi:MAG: glutamine synthetase III, partial [Elainellaceae cyanobacterium]